MFPAPRLTTIDDLSNKLSLISPSKSYKKCLRQIKHSEYNMTRRGSFIHDQTDTENDSIGWKAPGFIRVDNNIYDNTKLYTGIKIISHDFYSSIQPLINVVKSIKVVYNCKNGLGQNDSVTIPSEIVKLYFKDGEVDIFNMLFHYDNHITNFNSIVSISIKIPPEDKHKFSLVKLCYSFINVDCCPIDNYVKFKTYESHNLDPIQYPNSENMYGKSIRTISPSYYIIQINLSEISEVAITRIILKIKHFKTKHWYESQIVLDAADIQAIQQKFQSDLEILNTDGAIKYYILPVNSAITLHRFRSVTQLPPTGMPSNPHQVMVEITNNRFIDSVKIISAGSNIFHEQKFGMGSELNNFILCRKLSI